MSARNCIILFLLFAAGYASADLQVPNVLSDGVVFQQNRPVKIWGTGNAGTTVTVTLLHNSDSSVMDTASATVAPDGRWEVSLSGRSASYQKHTVQVEDAQNTITIHDVLFGEVWMVSGQSNMNLALKYIRNSQDIETAVNTADNQYIRGLNSSEAVVVGGMACSQTPLDDIPGAHWGIASNFNGVADLSGVGMTFALKLFDRLNQNGNEVPVAILSQTRGATSIHAWLSYEATQSSPELMEKYPETWSGSGDFASDFNQATACYNHFIGPLTNLQFAGILWYQGENNVGNESAGVYYREALAALIEGWRTDFSSPDASAFSVQLAPHHYWPILESAAYIREAQDEVLRVDIDPAGAAVSIHDLPLQWRSDTFPYDAPIHPLAKQEVGNRLGNAAYAMRYGGEIEYLGPVFESMRPKEGGLEIIFTHTSGGLKTVDGSGDTVRGFSVCGSDRVFYPAVATVTGSNTVILSNPSVPVPAAATYAFSSLNQYANLSNGAGLPARPFRTDKVDSVYNAPLQWMHCDTTTNWHNIKSDAYFTNTWSAGAGVTDLSLTQAKCEGNAALRIDYEAQAAQNNRVVVSPVLAVGNLQLDQYPGLRLSLCKPGDETIRVSIVFTTADGVRHRLRETSETVSGVYDGLTVSGSGWHEPAFSFGVPHLDSDGLTPSPAGSLSEIQELEVILEIPDGAPVESHVIIDDIRLCRLPSITTVQFGGAQECIADANWLSQIGADQIIQWNGINSWGGSFGANGTVVRRGIGAELWAKNQAVTLTSRAFSSLDPAGTNTVLYLDEIGVQGGADAKFDSSNDEQWTVDFDRTVTLKNLIVYGLNFDGEEVDVTVNGVYTNTFTRLDENSSPVSWDPDDSRYVYTFPDNGIRVPAGTGITIGATQVGQWALHGIVVELSDSSTGYNAWAAEWGIASATDDADGDGLKNLYEFALGGDPTNPADRGIQPVFSKAGDRLVYIYPRRADPQSGLSYSLQTAETLQSPVWTHTGYQTSVSSGGLFDFVANEIILNRSAAFFRLSVNDSF